MIRVQYSSVGCIPFNVVEEVLWHFVYVEDFISGEGQVDAASQAHLPQLLGGLVWIQAAVAQQEANYRKEATVIKQSAQLKEYY